MVPKLYSMYFCLFSTSTSCSLWQTPPSLSIPICNWHNYQLPAQWHVARGSSASSGWSPGNRSSHVLGPWIVETAGSNRLCPIPSSVRCPKHSSSPWLCQGKGRWGRAVPEGRRRARTCCVRHDGGADSWSHPSFQSDAMTTELNAVTVITVYLTIVGLVYKFKANILMHLLFFRNHT